MIIKSRVLLVEGWDDKHVVWNLAQHHGLPETFRVKDEDGVENLLRALPVQLKGSGIERVGVLLDADLDLAARWTALATILKASGYRMVPEAPEPNGTVLIEGGLPHFGA